MTDHEAVHNHNHAIGRELPPGWWQLYDETMLRMAELDPGRRVTRVREKAASMRIDVELWPSPEVGLLLMEAARRSKTICDICGGEGRPVRTGSDGGAPGAPGTSRSGPGFSCGRSRLSNDRHPLRRARSGCFSVPGG